MHNPVLVMASNQRLSSLIARILRWRNIFCLPISLGSESLASYSPCGLIVAIENESDFAKVDTSLWQASYPILFLGASAVAYCTMLGGEASPIPQENALNLTFAQEKLFSHIDNGERILTSLQALTLPSCLQAIAYAGETVIGYAQKEKAIYGIEYPIERNDPDASNLLYNFANTLCHATPEWTEEAIIQEAIHSIKQLAGDGDVLCAVSGGVDSTVCAKLAQLAVGKRLHCIFIDTGLHREGEAQQVINLMLENMELVVAYEDAEDNFQTALQDVHLPQEKEKVASLLMHAMVRKQLQYIPKTTLLITGANLTDALEMGLNPENNELTTYAPLALLFKHEVRNLASALQLPPFIVNRQPFPSSGLALRIAGEVTQERLTMLRIADYQFQQEIEAAGLDKKLDRFYASLLQLTDGTYQVTLHALQKSSHNTHVARLPFDVLERIQARIIQKVSDVSQVVLALNVVKARVGEE